MPDDIIKKILDDMDKQGFPLEVRVTELLKTNGWSVNNQKAYFDTETGKQRTIDIEGAKDFDVLPLEKYPHDWTFQVRLTVECKKSSKPWVFYASNMGRDEIEQRLQIDAQIHTDEVGQLAYPKEPHDEIIDYVYRFKRKLVRPALDRLANIAYEPFTNGKGHSIHKARMQIIGALMDIRQKLTQDTVEILHCILFKPVIVFDGELYVYQDQSLSRSEGLYYLVSHHDSRFIIEVVTIDFLQAYLKGIENNIGDFQRSFRIKDK